MSFHPRENFQVNASYKDTPPVAQAPSAAGEFREDINGLRALAVVLVVFFHFDLFGMTGGYLGVDVFYVISGYLMTRIVMRGLDRGAFSLLVFYAGRARRIIPALAALCVAVLGVGWFWLMPSDYKMLSDHAAAAMGFYSNFVFQMEEGYFDTPSQYKWLLHTWSLSVEWQFYMIYPLFLMLLAKLAGLRSRLFVAGLWGLAALSLLVSVVSTPDHASFAFYLLPTRIWQLMAGALVFVHLRDGMKDREKARIVEILGIVLVILPAFVFDAESPWPGYYALMPVIGTALVLIAARQGSWLTGPAVFQKLGLWSYSIYLWHWPVVVGLGHFQLNRDPVWLAGGVVFSLLLGWASYRFIEQPFRVDKRKSPARILGVSVACVAALIATGKMFSAQDGFPGRVSPAVQQVEQGAKLAPAGKPAPGKETCGYIRKAGSVEPCILGNPDNIEYVVWGDSHARVLAPIVQKAAGENAGVARFTTQCVTIFNTELVSKSRAQKCTEFNDAVLAQVEKMPPDVPVIVQNRYALHLQGSNEGVQRRFGIIYDDVPGPDENQLELYKKKLPESLCRIARTRTVYAVRPVPEMGQDVPRKVGRLLMAGLPVEDIFVARAEYEERNKTVNEALDNAAAQCGVVLLDPAEYLCDAEKCIGSHDGKPLYVDDDHLNEYGSGFLVEMFEKAFAERDGK